MLNTQVISSQPKQNWLIGLFFKVLVRLADQSRKPTKIDDYYLNSMPILGTQSKYCFQAINKNSQLNQNMFSLQTRV
jgi:hypothetical protein